MWRAFTFSIISFSLSIYLFLCLQSSLKMFSQYGSTYSNSLARREPQISLLSFYSLCTHGHLSLSPRHQNAIISTLVY